MHLAHGHSKLTFFRDFFFVAAFLGVVAFLVTDATQQLHSTHIFIGGMIKHYLGVVSYDRKKVGDAILKVCIVTFIKVK